MDKFIRNKDVTGNGDNENRGRKKSNLMASDWVLIVAAVCLVLFLSTAVVTRADEYSVIFQFSEIVRVIDEPGLNFKLPLIQVVERRENKILVYDITRSDVITSDKKTMIVDSYVLWRISDPRLYYRTLSGLRVNAEGRIDTVVYNAIMNTISSMTQEEVIVSRDGKLNVTQLELVTDAVFLDINDGTPLDPNRLIEIKSLTEGIADNLIDISDNGVEIITVEIKALDLPDSNKAAVYNRMISEREKVRTMYISEGEAEAQMIRNQADMDVNIMLAEAKSQAATIIAAGEAEYMRILATAYSDASKSEFYEFVRALDAAKIAFNNNNGNILVLDRHAPLSKIFYDFSGLGNQVSIEPPIFIFDNGGDEDVD
ncbi:MAG: protease modulator HflC [Lachnospiraceae bacterium]|jgi:membrane protease subunit HflC|nr:protease modulator HflC [Lachnospiraceae bacterium]